MDTQIIIPLLSTNTTLKDQPIVVSHTNLSPISNAKIQNSDLSKDLQPLATRYGLNLSESYATETLLCLLLMYQSSQNPSDSTNTYVGTAIKILETGWYTDIQDWSQNASLSFKNPNTGEAVWSMNLIRLVDLILTPFRHRTVYICFDTNGDISGKPDTTSIWRQGHFLQHLFDYESKTVTLLFDVNNQIKGLFLQANDIKRFDNLGIFFQHPKHPKYIISNPFTCDEFTNPRPGLDQRQREILSEIQSNYAASARKQPSTTYLEVCLN
jgi:hypothetical protein